MIKSSYREKLKNLHRQLDYNDYMEELCFEDFYDIFTKDFDSNQHEIVWNLYLYEIHYFIQGIRPAFNNLSLNSIEHSCKHKLKNGNFINANGLSSSSSKTKENKNNTIETLDTIIENFLEK